MEVYALNVFLVLIKKARIACHVSEIAYLARIVTLVWNVATISFLMKKTTNV